MQAPPARHLRFARAIALFAAIAPSTAFAQGPYDTTVINHGATFSTADPTKWCGGTCAPDATPPYPDPACTPLPGDCPVLDFSLPCSAPPVSAWLGTMAREILKAADATDTCPAAPSGSKGTVLEYQPCSGVWASVCGSEDPTGPIVLLFNWGWESDGLNQGGTYGYTEAAGDALYAALRDPVLPGALAGLDLLTGRSVHFIGHSRGMPTNSEAIERLSEAGYSIDHMTSLDPHPVDGSPPPDWGDPEPAVWLGVTAADDYWRTDLTPLDFDGQAVTGTTDLNLECALEETLAVGDHSEVHAWYHGTIDPSVTLPTTDGAGIAITADFYNVTKGSLHCMPYPGGDTIPGRASTGFSIAPTATSHTTPTFTLSVYNGDFEVVDPLLLPGDPSVGHAGWRYHGGTKSGTLTPWEEDGGNNFLRLETAGDTVMSHNRLYVDPRATALEFSRKRLGAAGTDDVLEVTLVEVTTAMTPAEIPLGPVPVSSMSESWGASSLAIGPGDRGQTYTLRFELVDSMGGSVTSTVDVDDIAFEVTTAPALPRRALVLVAALLAVAGALAAARAGARRSQQT